jgi:hypothetical protein
MKHKQHGFAHLVVLIIFVLVFVGAAGWLVYSRSKKDSEVSSSTAQVTQSSNKEAASTEEKKVAEVQKEPDSADTISTPEKVTSADGKTYFIYGAPAGQNNKETKTIIISLPGHGTTADDGYEAWKDHLDGSFALAEFNWWRGTGEKKTDYYDPASVVLQVRAFLDKQGYSANDIVILHGFSRGSANTYAVIANDRISRGSVFDAVISNAGKYQSDFPLVEGKTFTDVEMTQFFKDIPWVLACGGKDENPTRDGCPGMEETKAFLEAHQANVLGIVTDPNLGHGAFHMSKLGLPKQALNLIRAAL